MVILDKSCRDILGNRYLKDTRQGVALSEKYKAEEISFREYLREIYIGVDEWLKQLNSDEVAELLKTQEYFEFDVDKQLSKLSEDKHAAFIVEPALIKRIDDEGNHHYVLDGSKKSNDVVLKYLKLDPDKFQLFLDKLEHLNLYCMGLNWLHKPDSPTILIFGIQSYCEELSERLKKTYGIDS